MEKKVCPKRREEEGFNKGMTDFLSLKEKGCLKAENYVHR